MTHDETVEALKTATGYLRAIAYMQRPCECGELECAACMAQLALDEISHIVDVDKLMNDGDEK